MRDFIRENNICIKEGFIYYTNYKSREKIKKPFNIRLDRLREKLSRMDYEAEYGDKCNIKIPKIENAQMYPFAYVYYYYLAKNLTIPTPREFVKEYFDLFCEKIGDDLYKFNNNYSSNIEFTYDELASRILRSYNPYNREVEFMLNVMDKCKEFDVYYKLSMDLFKGIDLKITYNGISYGIAEYIESGRSRFFKNRKNEVRHDYSDVTMIDVVAKTSGPEQNTIAYGDVFCYSDDVVLKLKEKIKNQSITTDDLEL